MVRIKLGWLFPYSGIFKHLKKDLEQGLALGWETGGGDQVLVSCPAFIQTGSLKDTEDALKRLLLYEEVDLVIGVVSTKVALNIIPLVEKQQIPLLLLNLGADIPTRTLQSPYLFYNSLHLWKSEWTMGKWAQQRYGGEPAINLSLYEAGYGLHEAFKCGAAVSGATTAKLNIVKNFSPSPDVSPLIQYLHLQQPAHVHALLSGKEGELFLQLFHEQGFHHKIPLTVNPFMVEDGMPCEIEAGTTIFNASTWSRNLDSAHNRHFVTNYQARNNEYPHAFTLLAYEAGLALASAVGTIQGRIDSASIVGALEQVCPVGPRGELHFSTRCLQTRLPVYIRQSMIAHSSGLCENRIMATADGIEWNDPSLDGEQPISTGWQNPYLCV